MQVILILENQERPNVFAFYKYLLATPKKLYSHPQDDTSFMMIHHLFSWISYISILLGVLKIMNHISPTLGDRIQTCTAGRSTSPWAVALALFKRTAGADVQPCIQFLNKLILSVFKNIFCKRLCENSTNMHGYDIRPHWQYHFQDVPKKKSFA